MYSIVSIKDEKEISESDNEDFVTSPPTAGIMDFHDPYMEWYQRIT